MSGCAGNGGTVKVMSVWLTQPSQINSAAFISPRSLLLRSLLWTEIIRWSDARVQATYRSRILSACSREFLFLSQSENPDDSTPVLQRIMGLEASELKPTCKPWDRLLAPARPATIVMGNSRPFAAWIVITLTESLSDSGSTLSTALLFLSACELAQRKNLWRVPLVASLQALAWSTT